MPTLTPLTIAPETKKRLRILFIAKNALWKGDIHPEDGNHALYHREMRHILENMGLDLVIAEDFEILFGDPAVDFVFPLLNRAGFFNSEMLCPLLCERKRLPYLGASPILRGLADDKHLAKRAAREAGVQTAPWSIHRRGVKDKKRCRMHGGTNPGAPRGNRNAWKHGGRSAETLAAARCLRELAKNVGRLDF